MRGKGLHGYQTPVSCFAGECNELPLAHCPLPRFLHIQHHAYSPTAIVFGKSVQVFRDSLHISPELL